MRLVFSILIVLGFLLAFNRCTNSAKKKISNLRIAIDKDANFYLDSIQLSSSHKDDVHQQFDSAVNSMIYVFDSIATGPATITLVSVLNKTVQKNIQINKDTTVWIYANDLPSFAPPVRNEKYFPDFRIENGDSLIIGFIGSGCFNNVKETMVIKRSNDVYRIKYNTNRLRNYKNCGLIHFEKTFDTSFAKQLDSFHNSCHDLFKLSKEKGLYAVSTTSIEIYILKNGSVFQLPESGTFSNWKGYANLVNLLNPLSN